jgi:fibronectin-binding autotransporter adhesin
MIRKSVNAALLGALLASSVLHAQVVSESFRNSTLSDPNWVLSGNTYTPNLTGGSIDPNGDGWLRLTSTGGNQATSAYLDSSFTAAGATVYASFEYATWGGNGADGMTFFLFDGSVPFSVGAPGGSLGYANRNAEAGMAGGYIGVGIDEFGNFSSTSESKTGGLRGGLIPDAIAVRGSAASGYAFLGSSDTLATSIDTPGVGTRPTITNEVQILLTATNQLTVTLQQGGLNPQTVLQMDLSAYLRPSTLKLGFAGSTGGLNNVHEIRNVEASTIVASLWDNQGDSTWGNNNNWDPSVVPSVGADILFDNTNVSSDQTIDVGADREVRSISFDAPQDYTLNNNTITFDDQGVAGFSGIAASQTRGTGDHTINSDLVANNDIIIRNNNDGALTLTGDLDLNANDVTFDGAGALTSDSGVISGTGGLIKNDGGTVTLSGANTYSGGTTINNGTLNANDDDALGTAAVDLAGGTLGSTNSSSVANTISITGDSGLNGITTTGAITQTGDRTIDLANANLAGNYDIGGNDFTANVNAGSTISGIISNGSLTKEGTGTLTVSGANTYSGDTTINTGTLALGASNVISDASDVLIGSNGTFNLNGFSERIDDLEVLGGGAKLDFGANPGANEFLFGTYTAPPSGVLVVNNWEQGVDQLATRVDGQDVSTMYLSGHGVAEQVGSQVAVGALGNGYLITPVAVQFKEWDGSTGDDNWSTNNNWTAPGEPSTTQVALFGDLGVGHPDVDLNASYTIAGIRFDTDATVNYDITSTTNDITLAGTVPYIQQFSDEDQRIGFDDLFLANNTVVDITGAGDLTINADIKDSGGSRSLIKDGTGTGKLILDFNFATYTGGLFVNNGIVQARDDQSLGTGTANVADGATLEFSGSLGTIDQDINVTGSGVGDFGALRNVSGTSTLSATITATGDTKITADSGATSNYTGNITGTDVDLTFGGAGDINVDRITTGTGGVTVEAGTTTFQSGDANTYTGLTSITGGTLSLDKNAGVTAIGTGGADISGSGTLSLDSNNQIVDSAAVQLSDTATFDLNGNNERIAQIDSTDAGTTIALGTGGDLTVGAASVIYSNYEGQITGDATSTFNVDGLGTVYLAGDNSGMAGTFNVDSGTLNVRGNDDVLGTGNIVVDDGASLQIQGGISTDPADVTLAGTGTTGNGALQNVAGDNRIAGDFTLTDDTTIVSDSGTLRLGADFNGSVYEAGNQFALGTNDLTFDGAGDTVLQADLTGTGNLIKDGAGTFTMANGTNSWTGETQINDGEMVLATYFNDAPGVGPLADFGIRGPVTIGDGVDAPGTATLTLGTNEAGGPEDFANMFAGNVDVTVNSDGRFDTQGHTVYVRDLELDGGSVNAQNSSSGGNNLFVTGDITSTSTTQVATIDGRIDLNGDAAKTIDVVSGSTLDINARIQNGGFDKIGDGTVILAGGNTFTGDANISNGIARVENNLGLGAAAGDTTVDTGAQLQLAGVSIANEALTLNGSGISSDGALQTASGSGANSWGGNVTVASASEIQTNSGSTLAISGNITGSGQTVDFDSIGDTTLSGTNTFSTLNKNGAGNLTVTTGTNTISNVNINDGTFTLGTSNILTDAMDMNIGAGGTFDVGNFTDTIDDLDGSGTLTIGPSGSLTIDDLGKAGAFDGVLDVDGIFTMNGGTIGAADGTGSTGTMKLVDSGTLTITDDFDFSQGTLELTAGTTLALSGAGTQFDVGTLKITGDTIIDFGAGEATEFNLGALEISSGVAVTVNNWVQFQDLWTTGSFDGGFGSVTIDERDDNTAQITFTGFSPSDTIWLTEDFGTNEITVPEPSSYGAILMAFGLAAWQLRRPRRAAKA